MLLCDLPVKLPRIDFSRTTVTSTKYLSLFPYDLSKSTCLKICSHLMQKFLPVNSSCQQYFHLFVCDRVFLGAFLFSLSILNPVYSERRWVKIVNCLVSDIAQIIELYQAGAQDYRCFGLKIAMFPL